MSSSRELEKQIAQVERFRVRIVSGNGRRVRSDAAGFEDYPYRKAASSDLTVAGWIESRFRKHYGDYKVQVCDENGKSVHGRTSLITVRTLPKAKQEKQRVAFLEAASPVAPPELKPFAVQNNLAETPIEASLTSNIKNCILEILKRHEQPSASELVNKITVECGLNARWLIIETVSEMLENDTLRWAARPYLHAVVYSGDLQNAVNGDLEVDESVRSSIDSLIHRSRAYKHSREFKELIEFMARFRRIFRGHITHKSETHVEIVLPFS